MFLSRCQTFAINIAKLQKAQPWNSSAVKQICKIDQIQHLVLPNDDRSHWYSSCIKFASSPKGP